MILVCGEALFDLFADETSDRLTFDARIGGSPFNVAVGLARLGTPAAFFGALSHDLFGQRLRRALAAEGVDLSFALGTDALTTLSIVGLDDTGSPAYGFYGKDAADRQIRKSDLPDLPDSIDTIQIGSYATLVSPVGDSLLALAVREHGRRLIAYDPNVRPTVVADMSAWRERFADLLPHVDLLKISLEDLELMFPGNDPQTLAETWLAQGPALVIVTRGGDGATAFTARHRVEVAGDAVALVDTVGAGDTFQAAILARLGETCGRRRSALERLGDTDMLGLLRFAARAAALTCSRRGADLPRRAELGRSDIAVS
ncbi:carbohydrate kinase [Stappia sp. ES.058]|uniref:carbohydrate kinase family protein n=1 Tax=Stappia sp. ES.058 TaxID=1881061 RepID=UPI0008792F72|nr:carbohydrate kinase [Stappia sp. ES.058]SDU25694.1 fructokinase [Stappia sp. ES.058]